MFNIGCDLDGCVANIMDELTRRIKEQGWTTDVSKWTSFYIEENHPEIPIEWIIEQFNDPLLYLNATPYESAWHMINKWFMAGHNIYLVTARNNELKGITERWLQEWEIDYNRVIVGAKSHSKHLHIDELNLDFFIEDNPHEAQILGLHVPTFLIDHPYNRNYTAEGVTRAKDFYEIDKELESWARKLNAAIVER